MAGAWLTGLDRGAAAPVRLFCFAHAGGGSRFFAPWRAALEPDVQVCPVVLPGREHRGREQPYRRARPLAADLAEALIPLLDRPFAFFGHSLGALLAYETALALRRSGAPQPRVLFASARRAPQVPGTSRLHELPTDAFISTIVELGGMPEKIRRKRELLRFFLPTIRADYEITEVYDGEGAPPLECPVVACAGSDDPVAGPADLAAWEHVSTGPFELRVFDGDHFYLSGPPKALLHTIREHTRLIGAEAVPVG